MGRSRPLPPGSGSEKNQASFDAETGGDEVFRANQFEAAATEPPYLPYPAPKISESSRAPCLAEFTRAVDIDTSCQEKCGNKNPFPSMEHTDLAQLRSVVAFELSRT